MFRAKDLSEELSMSDRGSDRNLQVVHDYVDAFNRGDLVALRALFHDDAEIQGVLGKGQLDVVVPIWEQLVHGLGIQLRIDAAIASGDAVAVRYTETGTFREVCFGHPPTGRSYELVAMEWFEIRDGQIAKRWGARDQASQARQIGMPIE